MTLSCNGISSLLQYSSPIRPIAMTVYSSLLVCLSSSVCDKRRKILLLYAPARPLSAVTMIYPVFFTSSFLQHGMGCISTICSDIRNNFFDLITIRNVLFCILFCFLKLRGRNHFHCFRYLLCVCCRTNSILDFSKGCQAIHHPPITAICSLF